MLTTLAQLSVLARGANAALRGDRHAVARDVTIKSCRSVRFVMLGRSLMGGLRETPVAATPEAWFDTLIAAQALRVGLTNEPRDDDGIPERLAAAFVGGIDWRLEVALPNGTRQIWLQRWDGGDVTYGCIGTVDGAPPPPPDYEAASAELEGALIAIKAFADKAGHLDNFAKIFGDALGFVRAGQLVMAAEAAWVFGGMGSWNDIGFGDDAMHVEYERVSSDLYSAINTAILAAVNSDRM